MQDILDACCLARWSNWAKGLPQKKNKKETPEPLATWDVIMGTSHTHFRRTTTPCHPPGPIVSSSATETTSRISPSFHQVNLTGRLNRRGEVPAPGGDRWCQK